MQVDEALALLRDTHTFPGPFHFRVVIEPGARGAVIDAFRPFGELVEVQDKPSTKGTWLALRVSVRVEGAEQVLAAYDALKSVAGIRMVF